jgi:hypothetical protein
MAEIPASVAEFLRGKRIGVAGVSRQPGQAANAIYRKLRSAGYEVFALNPNAQEVEGVSAYPDLASIPARLDGLLIATHPRVSAVLVDQCAQKGVPTVWLHRSFGQGSVSEEAVAGCKARGITCIVGGCPLMYCEPVDLAHRCMRWWLQRRGRVSRA